MLVGRDIEDLPIRTATVDLAFLSQALHYAVHPERAVAEAYRIVKPGGRIAILDLNRHHFEEAREMYADLWLGFTELEIEKLLKGASFRSVETAVIYREPKPPHFEKSRSVMAIFLPRAPAACCPAGRADTPDSHSWV